MALSDFRDRGYLPEAMRNYLALLGWGPPDGVEIRPIEEIVAMFRLEDVTPSPAFFDTKKLDHINGEYIRALTVPEFVERAAAVPAAAASLEAVAAVDVARRRRSADRVRTLAEVPEMAEFLWLEEPKVDEAAWAKAMRDPKLARRHARPARSPASPTCRSTPGTSTPRSTPRPTRGRRPSRPR